MGSSEPPDSTVSSLPNEEGNDHPLTADLVVASLSVLSHDAEGRLVYAQANLSSLHLTSIARLSAYKHLQRLSLDDNMLVSLAPLRELRCLVYLSAANNKLTNDVFDDLLSSSHTLERLNLGGNLLTSLQGLHQLTFLMDFIAANNHLTEINSGDFDSLHSLTRLSLRSNKICGIHPNAFAACRTVRSLDLSHNALEEVPFVMHLADNLETLNLEHNKLRTLDGLEFLQDVAYLHLAHNQIESWDELEKLTGLASLCVLTLKDNPILQATNDFSFRKPRQESCGTQVSSDIDFVASKVSTQTCLSAPSDLRSTHLSNIVAPPARRFVQHLPKAPQGAHEWDDDSLEELAQMTISEQHRFRVISLLKQVLILDSVPVAPQEIPRAMRLFKRKCGGRHFATSELMQNEKVS